MRRCFALVMLALFAGVVSVPAQVAIEEPKEEAVVMAKLENDDVAVTLGGVSLTWGKLNQMMPADLKKQKLAQNPQFAEKLRSFLQKLVARGVMKEETKRMKLTVSKEEAQQYIEKLRKDFAAAGNTRSAEEYLMNFLQGVSDKWYEMTSAELLKTVKLNEIITKDVKVTEEDLRKYKAMIAETNKEYEAINEHLRDRFDEITNDARIETDNGFKAIAKKYSDGKEAKIGGVLGTFPRSVAARELDMEKFDLVKGENTDILENDRALRIVRVLDVIPAQKNGEEEYVKIAQIIFRKEEILPPAKDEQLMQIVRNTRKQEILQKYINDLIAKAAIDCPLFPKGLWNN